MTVDERRVLETGRDRLRGVLAGYNYTGQDGSHPVRERMRAVGMDDPPAEFLDPGGNLRLPHGSESGEQIGRFDSWRVPSDDRRPNRLWSVAAGSPSQRALWELFEPAVDTAFKGHA